MADIDWPINLRNALVSAKRVDRPGGFREVEVAAGPSFVEPFSDDTPTFFDITLRFTQPEARAFDAWIALHQHNTLAPLFNFPVGLPDPGATQQEARFVGRAPQRVSQSNQVYTYQGQILVRQIVSPDLDNPSALLTLAELSNYRDLEANAQLIDTVINIDWPRA